MGLPVLCWSLSAQLFEYLDKVALVVKAALHGNHINCLVCLCQQFAGLIDANGRNIGSGRHLHDFEELPPECRNAHI